MIKKRIKKKKKFRTFNDRVKPMTPCFVAQ